MNMNNFKYTDTLLKFDETTVIDFKEWIDYKDNNTNACKWFVNTFNVDGFMNGPVAAYKGKAIEAKVIKLYDIRDLYVEMNTFRMNESKFFLYKFEYWNTVDEYYTLHPETFEPKKLAVPRITQSYWQLRYGLI